MQELGGYGRRTGRDSTILKIVEVDMSTVALIGKPSYLTVFRKEWKGESHVTVFGAVKALAQTWKPMRIVIDATGVGEGLWSMLDNAFGRENGDAGEVHGQAEKRTGIRIHRDHRERAVPGIPSFRREAAQANGELPVGDRARGRRKRCGGGCRMGRRDKASGEPVHDDDLMTAAMCTLLDRMEWRPSLGAVWTTPKDPLKEMDGRF